jgi:FixJ family two-component response regulator
MTIANGCSSLWEHTSDGDRPSTADRAEPPAVSAEPYLATLEDVATVVVIDDQESVRESVANVLRSVGHVVIEASNALEALRVLGTVPCHAIVLDLKMPGLTGTELLHVLPEPPPTVVLSGAQPGEVELGVMAESVCAQLRKPVSPQRLIDAVASAVATGAAAPVQKRSRWT